MPFNVRCLGCQKMIGQGAARHPRDPRYRRLGFRLPLLFSGVRFNAKKEHDGFYHTTKIWKFTMTCHLCHHELIITTDPKVPTALHPYLPSSDLPPDHLSVCCLLLSAGLLPTAVCWSAAYCCLLVCCLLLSAAYCCLLVCCLLLSAGLLLLCCLRTSFHSPAAAEHRIRAHQRPRPQSRELRRRRCGHSRTDVSR